MVRINLLPVRVSKKKEAGRQQLVLFAGILVVGLALNYLWASSREGDLKARQQKLKRTQDEIASLERVIGEVRNIKEQQEALKAKLDVLGKLKAGRSGPVRMLDELATVTPRQLWLTGMTEQKGAVNFTGLGASIDDVSAFMSALKNSRYFSGVELKKTVLSESGKTSSNPLERLVTFEITANVNYAPGTEAPAADAPKGKG
jgi:type IV pilus assembly protein PilN